MILQARAHSTTNSLKKPIQPQPNGKCGLYFHSREIPVALGQQFIHNPITSSTSNLEKFQWLQENLKSNIVDLAPDTKPTSP